MTFSAVWGLLGFGGVAVSLGLKDVVSDFIAGVILMVNPTFKVGDTVSVCPVSPRSFTFTITNYTYQIRAGSVQGTVMGIGATSTTLLTRTGISKTPHTVSNRVVTLRLRYRVEQQAGMTGLQAAFVLPCDRSRMRR